MILPLGPLTPSSASFLSSLPMDMSPEMIEIGSMFTKRVIIPLELGEQDVPQRLSPQMLKYKDPEQQVYLLRRSSKKNSRGWGWGGWPTILKDKT